MKRRTVSARVFLLVALLTLLALPAAVATGVWFFEAQRQRDDLNGRLARASSYVRDHGVPSARAGSQRAYDRYLARFRIEAQVTRMGAGKNGIKDAVYTTPSLEDELRLKKRSATGQAGDSKVSSPNARSHVSYTYLLGATKAEGMLVADLYYRPANRTFRALLAIAAGAAALLLGLAAAVWLVGRWIVAPLRRLSEQVDHIAGGELALATTPSRVGEVENVSSALSGMASALKQAGEQDARVEEARRFLVTAVAHDLRTPLFSLRGYLEAIATGIGHPADYLPRAQAKAAQLERLVGSLFAYARGEYLDEEPVLEIADLGAVIRATVAGFEPAMIARGIAYRTAGDAEVLAVLDRERLERVVSNLVDNAVRYSPAGGAIEITWAADDEFAYVTIADDGPGIDDEALPRIFEPMYRRDDTRNTRTGGAGLGLTIARRLIEIQGGTIAAANRPRGGAVFTLRLRAAGRVSSGYSESVRRR
jgi:signal transduction histidine kinase